MNYIIDMNSCIRQVLSNSMQNITNDTIHCAIQWAKKQTIIIFMNINRIINKYIISKYVKKENKPG